jgi:hypothetical protein
MKILLSLAVTLLLTANVFAQTVDNQFGKPITETDAKPVAELASAMQGKAEMSAKVAGTVESVCQVKGCWMQVKTGDGKTMRVTFRDYGFFVPKDIVGQTVVMEGLAKQTTTPVSRLRHYAEDAGKSKAEIAQITEPETALTFVADGVIVKK